ncbi:MAG: methyltransferase domain-containing protein [Acidimicrobiia bacterium]|nr:methyltransferase domain-containing protein [Acidimicrobiia bacterium]
MADDAAPQPVVLVGLMGSGKTTVGRALAERLDYRFIDNDAGIEAEYDATGAELAERLGVERLHELEAAQLTNALDRFGGEPVVIATAASVVDDPECRSRLAGHRVVWLDAPPGYLAQRLGETDHRRKLGLDPARTLAVQASSRQSHFESVADVVVSVEGRSVHAIVEEILGALRPLPLMYTELAGWFHLITAPEDYAEEAGFYWATIRETARRPVRSLLELGSGGGNNAFHLKQHCDLTLVDLSPAMVELSREINPECHHHVGDMRTFDAGRRFDAVFIHDAIGYLTSLDEVRAAVENAARHLELGGVMLVVPDHVVENFQDGVEHGGHTRDGRSVQYEERTWDPDPADSTYLTHYVYRLSEHGEDVRTVEDTHVLGLFSRADWLEVIERAGLAAAAIPFDHSEVSYTPEVFTGTSEPDTA